MPELLTSHHLVITKAGGATIQEAIAARTPVLISQVVPGQEEGNARLIVENDCGQLAPDPDSIVEALDDAFTNGGALLEKWTQNVSKLSRPAASLQIARFILSLEDTEPNRKVLVPKIESTRSARKKSPSILLCDLHTHSIY